MAKKVQKLKPEEIVPVDINGNPDPYPEELCSPAVPATPGQIREGIVLEVRDRLLLADAFLKSIESLRGDNGKPLAFADRYSRVRAKLADTIGALR